MRDRLTPAKRERSWRPCEVCHRWEPIVGVVSSSLGPVSFAMCRGCVDRNAEPLWLWHFVIHAVGGPENIDPYAVKRASSYHQDAYIEWAGIVGSYDATEWPVKRC